MAVLPQALAVVGLGRRGGGGLGQHLAEDVGLGEALGADVEHVVGGAGRGGGQRQRGGGEAKQAACQKADRCIECGAHALSREFNRASLPSLAVARPR